MFRTFALVFAFATTVFCTNNAEADSRIVITVTAPVANPTANPQPTPFGNIGTGTNMTCTGANGAVATFKSTGPSSVTPYTGVPVSGVVVGTAFRFPIFGWELFAMFGSTPNTDTLDPVGPVRYITQSPADWAVYR